MKSKSLMILGCSFLLLLIAFTSAETKIIEYLFNLSWNPYCPAISCATINVTYNVSTFDNSTNMTINTTINNGTSTTCSATCYGKLKLEGVNGNNLFVEIDTGVEEWKSGRSDLRYGYKTAELGNLSDISGIRQELQNLTQCYNDATGYFTNLSVCLSDKSSLQTDKTNKETTISLKEQEINSLKNQKLLYGGIGIGIGLILAYMVVPWFKGRNKVKDLTDSAHPSNVRF